jgi:prepilin-type N-terminal cleavage/methylation domain-containing protein
MKMNIKILAILNRKGMTLMELIISIFIFSVVLIGILTLSVSTMNSYHKARAIKTIKENAEFAISSIAKDVRMGNIVTESGLGAEPAQELEVNRNQGGKVCYKVESEKILGYCESDCASCLSSTEMVNLDGTYSRFSDTTGFYSKPTDAAVAGSKERGWAEINLNIVPETGHEMEGDQINVQTTVSSRDYGWEPL